MKVLDAKVHWYEGYTNNPRMQVLVDKIPDPRDLVFECREGLYYAELDGYVEFYHYISPGNGFGGWSFDIKMKDGSNKVLKGPWSSRASVANSLGFGPCADIDITDKPEVMVKGHTFIGGHITLDLLQEAAKIAGVYLVKSVEKAYAIFRQGSADQSINHEDSVVPFDTIIPAGVEWWAVPSMSSEKIIKQEKVQ